MNILIKNCTVLPMTAAPDAPTKYFTGNIGISNGRIAFCSDRQENADDFEAACLGNSDGNYGGTALKVIDAKGRVAMPGLINLHNHAAMALMRSYADDMELMPWLQKIWAVEAGLTREDIFLGTSLAVAEMLLGGTTTFVDMYWETDMVAEAALNGGIRAVVSASFMDGKTDKAQADALRVIEKHHGRHGGMLEIMLAPHAPYTNSPQTIAIITELARKYGLKINVHLSETEEETRIIRERYGKTPAEYLEDTGLFELPTLAAHCVHMTESDMDILLRHGVSVSHNPQSNMKLASGIAPVKRMLEKGINVGIGTDGPTSNNDLDMWDEMRTASLLQKVASKDPAVLNAYETLRMATVHGAKALGHEGNLGVIAAGALADIILIDTYKPHMQPCNDLISTIVYCGKPSDVEMVIVNGRIVVEEGRLLHTDVPQLMDAAQARAARLGK